MEELTKEQILKGNYVFPTDLITLQTTKHLKYRLGQRGMEQDSIPSQVRVTRQNIHSAKTEDGKHLCSVVIRLWYDQNRYLFLCLNPLDGGLKTMWFRSAGRVLRSEKAIANRIQ